LIKPILMVVRDQGRQLEQPTDSDLVVTAAKNLTAKFSLAELGKFNEVDTFYVN